jgi:hypothetical protein
VIFCIVKGVRNVQILFPSVNNTTTRSSFCFPFAKDNCSIGTEKRTRKSCRCVLLRASLVFEGVSESFRTGRLEPELQMVQLSATRCNCIAILWVSLVTFAAITICIASQRVFVVVHFVIDSVRKLLYTPSVHVRHQLMTSNFNKCLQQI